MSESMEGETAVAELARDWQAMIDAALATPSSNGE